MTQAYYLISVSHREHLESCLEYGWAGFTNSQNGFWAFLDIEVGDYVSFLYGANIFNLYKVIGKFAYKGAEDLPPWPPIRFRESGKIYYFPFRLKLYKIRDLKESLIRPEFAFVAQNLLLRGGYRKTHFQSDSTSLSIVSQMGTFSPKEPLVDGFEGETFIPRITFDKAEVQHPQIHLFNEKILQSLIKKKIVDIMKEILGRLGSNNDPEDYEFLSEKALTRGFVDIFAKLRNPAGRSEAVIVEVKKDNINNKSVQQIQEYLEELGEDAIGGILVGKNFRGKLSPPENIIFVSYSFKDLPSDDTYDYRALLESLHLEILP